MEVKALKTMMCEMGACELVNNCQSLQDLIKLMTEPQGIEFCTKYKFPSARIWRAFKSTLPSSVKLDAGNIKLDNPTVVILAGDTTAELEYNTCDDRCVVLICRGAKAMIKTTGYGVVFYANCGGDIEIINKDNGKAYEL